MSNKPCIVSFASHGRENYNKFILGLVRSCKNSGWDGDFYIRSFDGYVDEYLGVPIINGSFPITKTYGLCYNQDEVPWGFKPHLIWEAHEKGYDQIIWCDSKIRMLRHPQPLLDLSKERGIVVFDNMGHPLYKWCSDYCQERAGLTPEEMACAKQIMGCLIIFDLSNKTGMTVFKYWMDMARDGVSFQNYSSKRLGFIDHRHDQAALSAILHKLKVPIEPYGALCYPPYDENKQFGEPYFVNSGT